MILNKARMSGETVRKYRESPDRDAAKDHKESLAMNAKCEADVFVSMSALKVKRTERQEFYAFFK